jgi:phosphoribosylanthranilate isomerase
MSASPRIKVCGLTRAEDARLAVQLGAWALGFIFHAASPRAATPAHVGSVLKELGPSGLKTVGVFVNASLEEIRQAVLVSGVDTVQLHGEETPQFCVQLKAVLPRISIFRALRPKNREELAALPGSGATCEAVLLDTTPRSFWLAASTPPISAKR